MDTRIALFAVALLSARAWAEDLPELPEVVITATREPTDILNSPSFVTVITDKDIQQSGAADLSAVLAAQSGVVVNDYGPQGQTKTVSIRGSTSSQVLVLVDGNRLNSSFDGSVDLSQIPVDAIDHIEIVRGGASSLWGTGAVGGVINIITKKAGAPGINLAITNGSYVPHDANGVNESGSYFVPASAMSLFDNQNVNFSLAGKLGDVGLTGGGSFTRAMNAFVWDDTANLGDWRVRNNAQDLAQSAYAGLDLPLLGGSFSTRGTFTHSFIGVPGSLLGVSSQETQEDTSATGSFSYGTSSFFNDRLSLDVKGSYRYSTEYLQNPVQPSAFTSTHTGNAASIDLTQKFAFADAASAVYGGTGSYEAVDSTNLSSQKDRLTLAGFVSLPVSPARPLTVTPSVRYDYYSDFPGSFSWQIGAVLLLSDVTSLKASVGSAYRVPTFEDLYWYSYDGSYAGNTYYSYGNQSLKPETSYNSEIGAAYAGKVFSFEMAVFARLLFNQIGWGSYNNSPSQPAVYVETPVNIQESFLPGAEIHATAALTDRVSLQASYTFIYSLLLQYLGQSYGPSDDLRVPYIPVHNASIAARYLDKINSAGIEVQYVGRKFVNPVNYPSWTLPGYVLLNAEYALTVSESMSFSIKLLNILNATYYTEAGFGPSDPGYPMPPFSIVTGMQLKL